MTAGYIQNIFHPGEMYDVFLNSGIRFQYPPSALLPLKVMPSPLAMREKASTASMWAVVLTIILAWAILIKRSPPRLTLGSSWLDPYVITCAIMVALLGVTYYPLIKGHNLGQIQVYLGALAAAALLGFVYGHQFLAGACFGLCCLVKPQYGLVFVWAVLRRQHKLFIAGALVFGAGLATALAVFGTKNYLGYLEVLRTLSRHGESYFPNESVNGLLHRLLGNGEVVHWRARKLPPYNPIVYYGSLASSVVILGVALFWPASRRWRGSVLDLSVVLVASTMASPIAWEHHYGVFFPILAAALPLFALRPVRAGLLLGSYALMCAEWLKPALWISNWCLSLLSVHIFWGGLLLFALLVAERARATSPVNRRGEPCSSSA